MSPRIMPVAAASGKSALPTAACSSTTCASTTFLPYPSSVSGAYSRVFPHLLVQARAAHRGPEPAPMPPAPPAPPMR